MIRRWEAWPLLAIVLLIGLGLRPAYGQYAEDFQGQLTIEYEVDSNPGGLDNRFLRVNPRWHLRMVDVSEKPLEEAAFLEHVPYAGLIFEFGQIDLGAGATADATSYGIEARYAHSFRPITAGIVAQFGTAKLPGGDQDRSSVELRTGYHLRRNVEAGIFYNLTTIDFPGPTDLDITGIGVYFKTVETIRFGRHVNFEASFFNQELDFAGTSTDANWVMMGADYYFTPLISVGAAITTTTDDFLDPFLYEIRGRVNVDSSLGIHITYRAVNEDSDNNAIIVAIVGRK